MDLKDIRDAIDTLATTAAENINEAADIVDTREAGVELVDGLRELIEKIDIELAPPPAKVLIQFSRDGTLYSIPSDPTLTGWLGVKTHAFPIPAPKARATGFVPVVFPKVRRKYWRDWIPPRTGLGLGTVQLGKTELCNPDDDMVGDWRNALVANSPAKRPAKKKAEAR